MHISKVHIVAIITALLLAACSDDDVQQIAGPGALGHIHDLVVTDDDQLLVASHSGLYRIDSVDEAVLVGTEQHDLMAMSADSEGLLASGHPDLRLKKYFVEDHPPHLGLARSADFGRTWTVEEELLGIRDFHAIVPTSDGIFAADAQGTILRRDPDGTWVELGDVTARDLAVSPATPDELIATDWDGIVLSSSDGALTWQPLVNAPNLLEIEWPEPELLLGASENGEIWTSTALADPWVEIAQAPPEVETFHVTDGQWWVTLHGGAIRTSLNDGQTWTTVYEPPER